MITYSVKHVPLRVPPTQGAFCKYDAITLISICQYIDGVVMDAANLSIYLNQIYNQCNCI